MAGKGAVKFGRVDVGFKRFEADMLTFEGHDAGARRCGPAVDPLPACRFCLHDVSFSRAGLRTVANPHRTRPKSSSHAV